MCHAATGSLSGWDTWNVTVQLHGISCPTEPEESAARAREYTMRRVLYSDVKVAVRGTGPHETVYGEVQTYDGKSLNAELVHVGLAFWAKKYAPNRGDIAAVESEARDSRRGIWGTANALDVPLPATPPPAIPKSAVKRRPANSAATATPHPAIPSDVKPSAAVLAPSQQPTLSPSPAVPRAHGLRTELSALRARGGRLKQKAELSKHAAPFLGAICVSALAAGIVAFGVQIMLAGSLVQRRLPYQLAVAGEVAIAAGLLTPLPYLAVSHMFTFGKGSPLSILVPPLIALCAWSSVVLCRREQILRAAPSIALSELTEKAMGDELVKVQGAAQPLPDTAPFVSKVGRIPAVYLKEITYTYEAVNSDPYYSARKKRGRRNTRYAWVVTYKETLQGEFVISDGADARALIDGDRAAYMPLRIARFYNDVPVEAWFSRPYPGDTRTEIEFIGTDAAVVVWGRVRRTLSGSPSIPRVRIANAPYQNTLVVEGDEARIWSRRPLVGLLLTLAALGLSLFLVYGLSTPGAPVSR